MRNMWYQRGKNNWKWSKVVLIKFHAGMKNRKWNILLDGLNI